MQITYVGPHPEVVVDELNSEQVIVNGEPVEIPDDLAARLLEQNTWTLAGAPEIAPAPEPAPIAEPQPADTRPVDTDVATTTQEVS